MVDERSIGQIETGPDFREMQAQVEQHVLILCTFAGKQKGELALTA